MSSQTFTGIESAALRATGGHIPITVMGPLFRPSTRYLVTKSPLPPFAKGGRHEYVGGILSPAPRHPASGKVTGLPVTAECSIASVTSSVSRASRAVASTHGLPTAR